MSWARCCVAGLLALPGPLLAAGMSNHALMAEYGRQYLPDAHPLRELMEAHRPALLAGAMYPDGGYATGAAFPADREVAETAHWEYFVDPLIQHLHDDGCMAAEAGLTSLPVIGDTPAIVAEGVAALAPLAEIRQDDSCGARIAFAFGMAAHGLGDEVWDALFEPQVRARGEHLVSSPAFTLDSFPPGADPSVGTVLRVIIGDEPFATLASAFDPLSLNSIEYATEVISIRENDLWLDVPVLVFPPFADLAAAYAGSGREVDANRLAIERAALATKALVAAERLGAAAEYDRVRAQMPFASRHYFTGSGGVLHTGRMITGYWLHLWDKLQQGVVAARGPLVVGVHPDPGERGVPIEDGDPDRWVRVFVSSSPDRALLASDPGALVLFDGEGRIVPATVSGSPSLYEGEGTHGIGLRISGALQPDTEYTAVLTTRTRDVRGRALLEPYVWTFRTAGDV
ncbi:MAG: Ig-like domain-containing protein [Oceanococcaceae bacterium]